MISAGDFRNGNRNPYAGSANQNTAVRLPGCDCPRHFFTVLGVIAAFFPVGHIIAFGARIIGIELAKDIVKAYLSAEFLGGRHEARVAMIAGLEERFSYRPDKCSALSWLYMLKFNNLENIPL